MKEIKLINTYLDLPSNFYSEEVAESFSSPQILALNEDLAKQINLDTSGVDPESLARLFAGQDLFAGTKPVALAYAGHQFGQFVPQLGDGRALLLGQVDTKELGLIDIQLKGSGRTLYSRGGDGKSGLGPVIREYLLSEAMYAMGIPSTRALAAVITGDNVQRESSEPGAILTRIASSHLRVGSFEFFAAKQDIEGLRQLTKYAIKRHYSEVEKADDPFFDFFRAVGKKQSLLVAKWLSVGFIHGVMNTDNFSICGETIDFGPCAFMDNYDVNKVFSSIDRRGRYSYSNQSPVALWNLSRLANCLLFLYEEEEQFEVAKKYQKALHDLDQIFQRDRDAAFAAKIGLTLEDPEAQERVADVLHVLDKDKLDFTLSFSQLRAFLTDKELPLKDYASPKFLKVLGDLKAYHISIDSELSDLDISLCQANPGLVPRNHLVQKAIDLAVEGKYEFFHRFHFALKSPCFVSDENRDLLKPPTEEEKVTQTFCGT